MLATAYSNVFKRALFAASLALALGGVLSACGTGAAQLASQPAPSAPSALSAPGDATARQTVPVLRDLPARIEATERAELRSPVAGVVQTVAFAEGSRVREGQLLVQIDPAPYAAALAAAQASLDQAASRMRIAQAEADRAMRLIRREAVSREEVARRRAEAAAAAADWAATRSAVARARLGLEHSRIVAPIAGRIGRAEVTMGEVVGPEDRLGVIVGDARLRVSFEVPASVLAGRDQSIWTAHLSVPDAAERDFEGSVTFLQDEANGGGGARRAWMELAGDPVLVPGRYGFVRLQRARRGEELLADGRAENAGR